MHLLEYAQQFLFVDDENSGRCNRRCRAHPDRLARHASLAKKVTGAEHRHHRFLSGTVNHREFHAALLDVHDAVCCLPLRIDRFASSKLYNSSGDSRGIEEHLWVEIVDLATILEVSRFRIQGKSPSLPSRSTATP